MSVLQEIKRDIPDAARRLEEADLHSDSEILSLTREDLRDLFPGAENFKLRRRVYEIIHRQKPIGVQKEMQQLIQHESLRGSLPSTSATSNPGECPKNQTDDHPPEAKDADMSVLLNEIKLFSPEAASTLEEAGLHSDSEILSLTREDLRDLFPEAKNFKLRRRVYEIIHRQKPIGVLKEMQQLIQHESLRAALTDNGVLVECLPILKDIKTEVNNVQFFLDSHINLLESISNNQQDPEPNKGYNADADMSVLLEIKCYNPEAASTLERSRPSTSAPSNPGECPKNQTDDHPQEAKDADMSVLQEEIKRDIPDAASMLERTKALMGWPFSLLTGGRPQKSQSTVTYEVVVCGKTFDAHLQLMNFVKSPVQDGLQFIESNKDSQVVVVFCPISSRVGSDVEAAMRDVKVSTVEKPVILVLMHHRRDAGSTNFGRTWDTPNVVLCVSVFYHETINGLVKCDENKAALAQIRMKLMEYKTEVKIPLQVDG